MPGVNSTSASRYESGWEMDYDRYQHYFYDDHDPDEDFSKSTAPSEDIWKKFELVPTPPMSPIWTLDGAAGVGVVHPSLGDKLEWVSQFLGQEDDHDVPCKLSSADEALGNLSSIIVRDCMWSGFSAGKQLEKVVGERLASCPVSGPTKLPVQALGAAIITAAGRAQCAAVPVDAAVPVLGSLATDCVDPAAVLAFPLTGGTFKKPSVSSGSETHTDSSDDESSDHDDDDDDGDEEEIDVVTVEHKQYKPRRVVNGRVTGGRGGGLNRRTPVTIMVRADPLNPCMKRFHISIHQQHHNYAAPSPDTHPDTHTAPNLPRKRVRHEPPNSSHSFSNFTHTQPHHHPASTSNQTSESKPHVAIATIGSESSDANTPSLCGSPSASPRLSSSHPCSPQSSDYEDTDKRKTHNFLERKRRNDLRSRFLTLRDEIPGLAECSKTPKVAILMRATEYLGQLHSSERQRAQEKRQLKARQQQLLRRLAQLKQRP